MKNLYELRNITRVYGERTVLNIPELIIEPRTIYGLLGPNGAGKTTLMKILSFMDSPTTGDIWFEGERVPLDKGARLRSRVVWVPQSPVMFTGSVAYNIAYPMRIKGVPAKLRKERIEELLDIVGLGHLAKAPAQKLSGGEAQRASIARALAAGAEVILFDEPTASVDFTARGEIIRLIRMLHEKRNLSLIVTTHDRSLARELCSRYITLFDGRLLPELSEEASLFRQDEVVFPAEVHERDGRLVLYIQKSSIFPKNAAVTVCGMALVGGGLQVHLALKEGGTLPVHIRNKKHIRLMENMTLHQPFQAVAAELSEKVLG